MATDDVDADGRPADGAGDERAEGRDALDSAEEQVLFERYAASRDRRLRNQLVERHMGLAAHVARRYSRRGAPDDDLRQVAFMALVKAVDRFEPTRGVAFSTFAGRTIEGEIKRHFRDHTWSLRVPRSAKEMHLQLRRAIDELSQRLGRSPTVPQLAEYLGVSVDQVIDGIAAGAATSTSSLDAPAGQDNDGPRQIGGVDPGFGDVIDGGLVEQLLQQLPPREQEIVRLRFFEELSQSEIAERIGISQMHVSRLLRKSFEVMRAHADAP